MSTHDESHSHLQLNLSKTTSITNILSVRSQLLNSAHTQGKRIDYLKVWIPESRDPWGPLCHFTQNHFLPLLIASFPVQDVLMKRMGLCFPLSSVTESGE